MGVDLALGDLDLDGDLDAVIANMDRPNEIWLYEAGAFVDSGLRLGDNSELSGMPELGDLDGDEDLTSCLAGSGAARKSGLIKPYRRAHENNPTRLQD